MNLQQAEQTLATLEAEASKIKGLGQLHAALHALQTELTENQRTMIEASKRMSVSEERLEQVQKALADGLEKSRREVQRQAEQFGKTVETQLLVTTTQYENFVRNETRAVSDRLELNNRDMKQFMAEVVERVASKIADEMTQTRNAQRRNFYWLLLTTLGNIALLAVYLAWLKP